MVAVGEFMKVVESFNETTNALTKLVEASAVNPDDCSEEGFNKISGFRGFSK